MSISRPLLSAFSFDLNQLNLLIQTNSPPKWLEINAANNGILAQEITKFKVWGTKNMNLNAHLSK